MNIIDEFSNSTINLDNLDIKETNEKQQKLINLLEIIKEDINLIKKLHPKEKETELINQLNKVEVLKNRLLNIQNKYDKIQIKIDNLDYKFNQLEN